MDDIYRHAMNWVYRLDRHDWFIVMVVALVLGAFFLRGFGSRKFY